MIVNINVLWRHLLHFNSILTSQRWQNNFFSTLTYNVIPEYDYYFGFNAIFASASSLDRYLLILVPSGSTVFILSTQVWTILLGFLQGVVLQFPLILINTVIEF